MVPLASSRLNRSRTVARMTAATGAVVVLAASACSTSNADHQVEVSALWYGVQSSGEILQGTTPVTISAARNSDRADMAVDLSGMSEAGGPVWNAAARTAASVAVLGTGIRPAGTVVSMRVGEEIDGPSAGALLTVGTTAALLGGKVVSGQSMTGTILPSGGVGPVGGVPAKVRAAADAGMSRILIPAGQRESVDPETSRRVDVVELGRSVGVDVVEVESVRAAFRELGVADNLLPTADPPPLSPEAIAILNDSAERTTQQLRTIRRELAQVRAPDAPATATVQAAVTSALTRIPELVGENRLVAASARGLLTERLVASWRAESATAAAGSGVDVEAVANRLVSEANGLKVAADAATDDVAGTVPDSAEEVAALVEALTWSIDASVYAEAISDRLRDTAWMESDRDELTSIAGELAELRFDVKSIQPVAVKVATVAGATAIEDPSSLPALLNSYRDLMNESASANLDYLDQLTRTLDSTDEQDEIYLRLLAEPAPQDDAPTELAQSLQSTARAMAYFVGSMGAVSQTGIAAAAADSQSRYRILSRDDFERQVAVADQELNFSAGALASLGTGVNYLLWAGDLGTEMARITSLAGATDQLRREGLYQQWFTIVAGKLQLALTHPR